MIMMIMIMMMQSGVDDHDDAECRMMNIHTICLPNRLVPLRVLS